MRSMILPLLPLVEERVRVTESAVGDMASATLSAAREPLQLEWEDGAGRPVGKPWSVDIGLPQLIEAYWADGRIGAIATVPDLVIDKRPPRAAATLILRSNKNFSRHDIKSLSVDRRALGAPRLRSFPNAQLPIQYPVFGDGFDRIDAFHAAVQALYSWIQERAPFRETAVRARFALQAFFWPAPGPGVSHFDAPLFGQADCSGAAVNPVLHGSNEKASKLLSKHMWKGRGLVLMNSRRRGGAGPARGTSHPAWASIGSCPGEDWQAVALHEMAHGFGLADEYVLPNEEIYRPWRTMAYGNEPNVSPETDPAAVPWHASNNLGLDGSKPTVALAEQGQWVDPEPGGQPTIGTFAGAFYRETGHRPAASCLMRTLSTTSFCPVCAAHLRGKIAPK
jgi:IgA Peptidase M64